MDSSLTYTTKTELFKDLEDHRDGEFFAVIDAKVKNHLPQWIQFSPQVFWLQHPEEEKNLSRYGEAAEFFLKQAIHRKSVIYAFGGGATTDLAGFIAATILRGVHWRAVPTTLLAMVDASLGGKVGVNTELGKNLLGAFYQPEKVFLCPDFLNSLDAENWLSGKGEILKYAFLSSEIRDLVLKKADTGKIIEACARFKLAIVEGDLREQGERIKLNLGHTLGHAFESTLKLSHGLAVAMGLRYILEVMEKKKALEQWSELVEALALPRERLELRHYPHFEKSKFFQYLQRDKKRQGSHVRLVLVESVGQAYTEDILLSELISRIRQHADFADQ